MNCIVCGAKTSNYVEVIPDWMSPLCCTCQTATVLNDYTQCARTHRSACLHGLEEFTKERRKRLVRHGFDPSIDIPVKVIPQKEEERHEH